MILNRLTGATAVVGIFGLTLAVGFPAPATSQDVQRPIAVVHHPVSTTNAQAQAAFDRGLLDYYAYNPEAAGHEFYTAADLDPHLAMAWWGIAMSNASNLNVPSTDDREQQAEEAIGQAQVLEKYTSPEERALIEAAALRFSSAPKANRKALLTKYRDALQRVAAQNPNDPDAAALYGEASLYVAVSDAPNGVDVLTPAKRAAFVAHIAQLMPYFQAQLAKFPQHVGLLHFYVHSADSGNQQQAAVDASKRLAAFDLPPEDSHLTHMPGHIYFKVGMYDDALDVATRSVAMDHAAFDCCHPGYYSGPRYYHDHNVAFLLYAMTVTGKTAQAVDVAQRENNDVFLARQLIADRRWHDVLAIPYKKGNSDTLPFARGIAFANLGNIPAAEQALKEMAPPPADSPSFAATVTAMQLLLRATIAQNNADNAKALTLLQQASVAADKGDRLWYAEFPALYYYSPHLALAQLSERLGRTDIARKALQDELTMNPRSPAATQGLAQLAKQR
jgi:hypothetical protein